MSPDGKIELRKMEGWGAGTELRRRVVGFELGVVKRDVLGDEIGWVKKEILGGGGDLKPL